MMKHDLKKIACQGCAGAFSHLAAQEIFPDASFVFFPTFEQTIQAVQQDIADSAVMPVENSAAGRVADMHTLLPGSDLFITGEHFLRIQHQLLGQKNAKISDIKAVRSHQQALTQCSKTLKSLGIESQAATNTAQAAQEAADTKDISIGVIASVVAAEIYGLKVLKANMEDSPLNTTRFWVLSKKEAENVDPEKSITSFVFWVKNLPAVLYKSLGGFATNGINILRLESYVSPDAFFTSAGFLVDIAAHPQTDAFRRAFDELAFFAQDIKILGTYPASFFRKQTEKQAEKK